MMISVFNTQMIEDQEPEVENRRFLRKPFL